MSAVAGVPLARVLLVSALLLAASVAGAVLPSERLEDPALEARAREISAGIRCVVCQNESIDSSGAGIARDMRVLIRERLAAGDSDREVRNFLVARYGDYVLLQPPFASYTLLLWLGPAAVLLLGGLGAALYLRGQRRASAETPLSAEERERLAGLTEPAGGGAPRP